MVKVLPFLHQHDEVARKAINVSAVDWRYQTHKKRIVFFHVCCYGFSKCWKSLIDDMINNSVHLPSLIVHGQAKENLDRREYICNFKMKLVPIIIFIQETVHRPRLTRLQQTWSTTKHNLWFRNDNSYDFLLL